MSLPPRGFVQVGPVGVLDMPRNGEGSKTKT